MLSLVERDYDNALPLRELTEVITAISKSNVFHAISATVPNGIDIMFNGYTERLSETEAIPIIYIIQGEDIVPIWGLVLLIAPVVILALSCGALYMASRRFSHLESGTKERRGNKATSILCLILCVLLVVFEVVPTIQYLYP